MLLLVHRESRPQQRDQSPLPSSQTVSQVLPPVLHFEGLRRRSIGGRGTHRYPLGPQETFLWIMLASFNLFNCYLNVLKSLPSVKITFLISYVSLAAAPSLPPTSWQPNLLKNCFLATLTVSPPFTLHANGTPLLPPIPKCRVLQGSLLTPHSLPKWPGKCCVFGYHPQMADIWAYISSLHRHRALHPAQICPDQPTGCPTGTASQAHLRPAVISGPVV